MQTDSGVWQYIFWGNKVESYAMALLAFAIFSVLFYLFQALILSKLKRVALDNESRSGNAFVNILGSIRPPFYYFVALYLSFRYLTIDPPIEKIIHAILIAWIVYEAILSIQIFIDYLVRRSFGKERERDAKSALGPIKTFSSIILWFLGALFVFSNLGINISSLVAGLGIGGIAIALGIQNILKDLFSSFSIYFDKPFSIGDYIVVGDLEGEVKQIGIKSTRLLAFQGEEIIISNQELTSSKIRNFSKLKERRVTFPFKIESAVASKKVEALPELITKSVNKIDGVRLDRVSLTGFDKDGTSFEAVYFIESSKYSVYIETQQKVLLSIKEQLLAEKIKLA